MIRFKLREKTVRLIMVVKTKHLMEEVKARLLIEEVRIFHLMAIRGLFQIINQVLTLFAVGLSGGGMFTTPLLNTQNHCEKPPIIFPFQIGHIEIRKVIKFWGILRPF